MLLFLFLAREWVKQDPIMQIFRPVKKRDNAL